MDKPYEIHVVSNTHWDREWLHDFQETRVMLVEFFDRLLAVLEQEEGYHSFLLDSQTVPLEDYLEIRPEKREILQRYITEGRICVGPWYTCPECFCVAPESLVRNLLYGHRVARSFGRVMKVGHTPFSYGQNSQMPQLYTGFGIDTILFYHGVSHDDTPNEFWFEGADGTRIFASQMSSGARYNFYHNVYRRVRYGSKPLDREYAWAQGGLPFHLCTPAYCTGHHFLLDPATGFHEEYIEECVKALKEDEVNTSTTPFLAFMDGHDSSVADAATLRIIEKAKDCLPDATIAHSSLPELMEKVKGAAKDLTVLQGERRVPKPMGARVHLYHDVLSCRTRMKRLNTEAETLLQRWAEPWAALASTFGAEYPQTLFDLAWKTLLRCHAHDSIAGTGIDEIARDMDYRLRQVVNMAKAATSRGLQHIQARIDNSALPEDGVALTVFNPSPMPRPEVITAVVDLPEDAAYQDISLVEAESGKAVPIQISSRRPHHAVVNHAGDATAMMTCERAVVHFEADGLPALGYATYYLARTAPPVHRGLVSGTNAMENEHLHVQIHGDGTLSVTDKETDATFHGLHYFQDGGEAGNAWMHIEPAEDAIVTTLGTPARVALEEDGPLSATYRIDYTISVPVRLEENGSDPWKRLDGGPNDSRRSAERRSMQISSWVTLRKGARRIEFRTVFDNPCNDHRLRVMFPTWLDADVCHAESAFDVVERPIEHDPGTPWAEAIHPTFPMQRFIDVSDGQVGLAVINEGLKEHQVTPEKERTIAITLMRAFEVSLTTVSFRWDRHPEMTGSQSHGEHEFRYAVVPHEGTWVEGGLLEESESFNVPLQAAQVGPHGGDLPRRMGFFSLSPENLVMTAFKAAEEPGAYIARFSNPTAESIDAKIVLHEAPAAAEIVTLEEVPAPDTPEAQSLSVEGCELSLALGPKRIATVKLRFA